MPCGGRMPADGGAFVLDGDLDAGQRMPEGPQTP